jgi:hypothetical protein
VTAVLWFGAGLAAGLLVGVALHFAQLHAPKEDQ